MTTLAGTNSFMNLFYFPEWIISSLLRHRLDDDIFAPHGLAYRRTSLKGHMPSFPNPLHKPGTEEPRAQTNFANKAL